MSRERRVVVGLDHSPSGAQALRWAVEEAEHLKASVTVLRVVDPDLRADLALVRDLDAERRDCHDDAHRWVAEALEDEPRASLTVLTRFGSVATELVVAATDGVMLVIGQPQDPRLADLPLALARQCACRVVCVDEHGNASFIGRESAMA